MNIYTGVSFTRDFLEMEQNVRTDSNLAYDIKEFTSKSAQCSYSCYVTAISLMYMYKLIQTHAIAS